MPILSKILDLLFPPKCPFCWRVLDFSDNSACEKCMGSLPFTDSDHKLHGKYFRVCAAPFFFDGMVRKSIHRYKFNGASWYSAAYGKMLADCVREHLPEFDVLTWVPLSEARFKSRGYDQAYLLAKAAGDNLGREPVATLRKTVDTKAQSEISDSRVRTDNVRDVYEISSPSTVNGRRILLIDDVVTTGATTDECARVLMEAGAKEVICAALASANLNNGMS